MKKLLIISLMITIASTAVYAGIEWTSVISTEGKKKRDNNRIISVISAQDGMVRQDFSEVKKKRGMFKENSYWIYNSKDKLIYVVDNKKRTVTPMSFEYMMNMAKMAGKLVKIRVEDYNASSESLGTEKINGVLCQRIKMVTDYTLKIKIAIIKKTMVIHEEKEIWGAGAFKGLRHLNQLFLGKKIRTGFADLDELIKKQMARHKKIGFPMKTVVRQITKNKKGKLKNEIVTTTTVEKIAIKKFPPSHFEIPKDYKINDTLAGPQN